jgi:Flp pilus assembly protein TadG
VKLRKCKPGKLFWASVEGIAAVEFALIMPFMILLLLGATDVTQALSADRKLGTLISSIGSLAAMEAVGTHSDAEITDLFEVSEAVMRPFESQETGMRITFAKFDSGTNAIVISSAAANGMDAYRAGAVVQIPEHFGPMTDGHCMVITQGVYAYKPLFATVFSGTFDLTQDSFDVPRKASSICDRAETICAGYSGSRPVGQNCNDRHNSWGNGSGRGGGISNNNP